MHHEEIGEDVDVLQHHVLTMREDLGPARLAGVGDGCGHQPEVARAVAVRPDVEPVAAVIDVVLVILLARLQQLPDPVRLRGGEEAHLRAREAVGSEEEELAAARAPHPEAEQLVRLLVEEIVGGGAEAVPPEPVRTLGVVFGDVEERGAFRRPRHRADFFGAIGKRLTHIMVVDADSGELPTWRRATLRYVVPIVLVIGLPGSLGLMAALLFGISWVLIDTRIGLMDRLGHTRVVLARYRPERPQ